MNEYSIEGNGEKFKDLMAYAGIKVKQKGYKGNIIKSHEITMSGTHAVEVQSGDSNKPEVVMHRNGEYVNRVEFICSCGKTTMLDFEYEGE